MYSFALWVNLPSSKRFTFTTFPIPKPYFRAKCYDFCHLVNAKVGKNLSIEVVDFSVCYQAYSLPFGGKSDLIKTFSFYSISKCNSHTFVQN